MLIDSPKNPRVKAWRRLQTKTGRAEAVSFLVEGPHLVAEALAGGAPIHELILSEGVAPPEGLAGNIPLIHVSARVMKDISETESPQGIIAVCGFSHEPPPAPNAGGFLLLHGVQDPGNVGTMIRTASAAGLAGVIAGPGSADIYNGKTVRASQGAIFQLPVFHAALDPWILRFRSAGIPVYAADARGGVPYREIQPSQHFALIVGNESAGLPEEIIQHAGQSVHIPIRGHAESLNVAVAAGILLFHLAAN